MTVRKSKQPAVQVRKIGIEWPHLLASASIDVAVHPDTPDEEARGVAMAILRLLIMQETMIKPLPTASDPSKDRKKSG